MTITAQDALTASGFHAAQVETLEREIEIFPARSWWPSVVGHPCDRALVWNWTRWGEKSRHDYALQSVFDEGNFHAPDVYRRLEAMGFELVRESDRPVEYKVGGGAIISGRPDGRIRGFRGERFNPTPILEIKTTQGHTWNKLHTIDDIRQAPQSYVRAYYDQGQLYCLLEHVPQGVIVMKSKATGLLKAIPYELDFGRAEWLLQRVERLQPMVDQAVDPPPITYDAGVCGRCAFNHLCYPARSMGEGTHVLDDSQLVEDLEAREKLKAAHDDYEDLDKGIKSRLKAAGIRSAIAGPFEITAEERAVREFTVKARVDTVIKIRRTE